MSTTEAVDGDLAAASAAEAAARTAAQDPADIIIAREERVSRRKAALNAMTRIEQQVLLSHESLGIPLSGVARRFHITEAAAAAHLARARAALDASDTP
jgi:DNA-directed RNA polymerase specialized sigma24 family protein